MSAPDQLDNRLSFLKFDAQAKEKLSGIRDILVQALPGALDVFYRQITTFPETRGFFGSAQHVEGAKQRQVSHWQRIAAGRFDQDYVAAVTKVGETHARIGLEPRWYIGGYALLLEKLITDVLEARWPKGRFGGKVEGAAERSAEVGALVKAALLDMDYAISVYLQASETARIKAEEQARAVERANAAEREKAVRHLSEGMAALAKGDLTFRIGQDIPAEYGMIRDNFNDAMARLEGMIATIKSSSVAIAASSQEINSGAEDLSLRTEQQAAALEQSAATTEQLAASVKTAAQSSRRSVALADDATKIARTGGTIVKDATDAMARIEEASQKISEITSVIDGIAFQTNLLALNAAVEAARAGEAGRGFAVVAAEVRALAQRSSDAAKDITGLIASSDAEVTEGVKLVRLAGDTLEQIVDASARVSATVEEIASASGEQANGIDEMSQTVSHMDGMTQQNAALAEQSAASARTLLDQIAQLNELVSTFRTQDSRGARPSSRAA
ncbi:MAG TPA: methyl-accepting chemotaxis protein [Bosea sp. (in: a-proteobacteria)]|jgi:methyl-accepting chemotaxis protein|uniref:methyl-accepting chemotaxis protein n=1 Tax=Bosea sp. (in: a-proteobacteria) TaxID=1871050 RepID=UPI002E101469|nr:methyl-accepting chemotaxis protein [Bosea sp. (in: a-proteobacteria)]